MVKTYKAILFDMDGILYDSEEFYHIGNYEVLVSLGYQGPKEALLRGVGGTVDYIITLYEELLDYRYTKQEIEKKVDAYYEKHPIDYRALMFEDIPHVVKDLHEKGYRLGCCSSSSKAIIKESLETMGIDSYFDYYQSSEEIGKEKPAPDIYLAACKAFALTPEECIVYEDSDAGIQAGKNAGMTVIGREDKRFGQKQDQADVLVKSATEMAQWVYEENAYAGNHEN